MFTRPRLPRPNVFHQGKRSSALAWPRFQTTNRAPRGRTETHEPATLAWLLGYGGPVQPSGAAWPDLPKLVSKKANAKLRRVRFLSIDIDDLHQDKAGIVQFDCGVSVFDTLSIIRQLKHPADPRKNLAVKMIQSAHYIVEDPRHGGGRRTSFAFGSCRVTSLKRLKQLLKKHTQHHNVVLVMHGAATEVSVMKRLDINLNPTFVIDTTTAVRHLFHRTNLKCLLEEYQIPHGGLHHAGNDAHFILRVLLMIAVRDVQAKLSKEERPDWVPIFEAVARSPKPQLETVRKEGPLIIPGDKVRKQMERRRKMLERLWKIEYEKEKREERGGELHRIPDCDSMSLPWADQYTIEQYGILP